jgi:hypothetical protein
VQDAHQFDSTAREKVPGRRDQDPRQGGSWKGHRREKSVYQLLNREEAEAPSTTPVKLNGVTRDYPRQSASDPLQIDAPIESEEQKEEEAANAQSLPVSHLIDSYIAVEPTAQKRSQVNRIFSTTGFPLFLTPGTEAAPLSCPVRAEPDHSARLHQRASD